MSVAFDFDSQLALALQRQPYSQSEQPHTGAKIISLLQHAADAAKSTEERAVAEVRRAAEDLRQVHVRIERLEREVELAEQRARDAEEWLMRICREIESGWVGSTVRGASKS